MREIAELACQWSHMGGGEPTPVVRLPMALAYFEAWLMEIMPGEPLMSRDNLETARVPSVASGELPTLAALQPLYVLTLQNGIGNVEALVAVLGTARVVAGVSMNSAACPGAVSVMAWS